jgi:hypothetical protein
MPKLPISPETMTDRTYHPDRDTHHANLVRKYRRRGTWTDEANFAPMLTIAHRAAWYLGYPENSIESIKAAIAHGIDIVEIDVRRSADGVLCLFHDSEVDRTTNGTGKIEQLTWDYIQSLYLKNDGCARSLRQGLSKEHPVSLKELFNHPDINGRIIFNMDKDPFLYKESVLALAREAGIADLCIVPYATTVAQMIPAIEQMRALFADPSTPTGISDDGSAFFVGKIGYDDRVEHIDLLVEHIDPYIVEIGYMNDGQRGASEEKM